jgi:uncharacterized protein YbaP (TraB family)
MKKFLLFIFSTVLLQPIKAADPAESLLWKISGNGIEKPSYLYGTMHMICQQDVRGTGQLSALIKEVDQLVLELDFDDQNMLAQVQKLMMMPDQELSDLLPESEFLQVKQFFADSLGYDINLLKNFKPFFLTSMLMPKMMGCQPVAMEIILTQLAQKEQMEILGLETVDEQMAAVDQIGNKEMASQVAEMISNYAEEKQRLLDFQQMYRDGKLSELQKAMKSYFSDTPEFEAIMIDDRNLDWIPEIVEMLTSKASLIAVGAGHLPGEKGVIELLKAKGYTLTPVAIH